MTLAVSMILPSKKVYVAEITSEGEFNSGIENFYVVVNFKRSKIYLFN